MVDIFEDSLMSGNTIDFNSLSKASLGKVSGAVSQRVLSGDEDALEVFIKAKALEQVAKNIISEVKSAATDEAERYSKADSKMMGCEFVVKNGATTYSFDHDEEWSNIDSKIKELTAMRKEREKKMIDAMNYAEVVDDETGEVIPPAEVKKGSGSVLTVTIPKE
jgi:hypothetical protein